MATCVGRRPVALIAGVISLVACVWRATATSYNSFVGACVLHGIGAGPAETLGPILIADVMFLHERGFWMNVYTWAYFGALMVSAVLDGKRALC